MPLRVSPSLRFQASGSESHLHRDAVDELLALARKVQNPRGYKATLEMFKENFSRSLGERHTSSSSVDWAETDLSFVADNCAGDSAAFIVAFCDACEELKRLGSAVPDHAVINQVLDSYGCPFQIRGSELIGSAPDVESPAPPDDPSNTVAMALADAAILVGSSGAASAIDRAHTALHGYLIHLCNQVEIDFPADSTTAKLFKILREEHPALKPQGPRAADITRILRAFATAFDALSPIRNMATLTHPNPLLDEPEAQAALNAARTLFRYIQDSIERYNRGSAT